MYNYTRMNALAKTKPYTWISAQVQIDSHIRIDVQIQINPNTTLNALVQKTSYT